MDFLDIIKKRHSVRSYSSQEVSEEKLQQLLSIVDNAPSAGGLKAYRIIIIRNKETREKLCSAALDQEFITEAPISLIFTANHRISSMKYGERGEELYSIQDATIAASYAQLAATYLGLSTVWVGAFDPKKVFEIAKCKEGETPIAIIPLGYEK